MAITRSFDPAIVREFFDYRDGKLIWKKRSQDWFSTKRSCSIWNVRYPGTEAGSLNTNGYVVIRLSILGFDSTFRASHLVWVWHHQRWPAECLDHIDHDRTNDRVENLREVTVSQNCRNRAKGPKTFGVNVSGKDGWWCARINVANRTLTLGSFQTEAEATAARRTAEILFDYHENHGRDPRQPKPSGKWKVFAEMTEDAA